MAKEMKECQYVFSHPNGGYQLCSREGEREFNGAVYCAGHAIMRAKDAVVERAAVMTHGVGDDAVTELIAAVHSLLKLDWKPLEAIDEDH